MTVYKIGRKYFSEEDVRKHFPSYLKKISELKNMTEKMTVTVSLPQGVTEENFGSILGTFRRKKFKDSDKEITTKSGKELFSMALDLTKLKALVSKYPALVKKDKRSGNDIVWVTGFKGKVEKSW
jgi:hypothetical protein